MGLFDVTGIGIVAVGKSAIHSLWIGLLILALLKITLNHVPDKFSNLRYGITVTALLLLFSTAIVTFFLLYQPPEDPRRSFIPLDFIGSLSGEPLSEGTGYTGPDYHRTFIILGQIYFSGLLAMLVRSAVSLLQIRQLRKSGLAIASEWKARLSRISESLGLTRSVEFLESVRVISPLLTGLLKPAIIVPAGMFTNLPFSQVESIIMHELYHLKRRDYLVNILQLFIECLLFYHPAVWIISGLIREEREHCCDDEVLRKIENPVNYAKALIHLAEVRRITRFAPGLAGGAKHHFKFRIHRILNHNTMKTDMREKAISLVILAGTVLLFLAASSFSAGPSFIRSGMMKNELVKLPESPILAAVADTIPQDRPPKETDHQEALKEIEESQLEKIKEELQTVREEALKEIEEIDWEKIKAEMEEARQEALKEIGEIDWEDIKSEVEEARQEAIKEIEEIDWEKIKAEMEDARKEAVTELSEIDMEKMKRELEKSVSEIRIDMEQMKIDMQNSVNQIDWEEIRKEMEKSLEYIDSIRIDLNQ